jgi:diamine N-acetyltransferase
MIDVKERDLPARTIGTIDLFDFDPYHFRAGVGILIGDKSDRNKGYATLALKKLITYCFSTLQLHQLYCNITLGNEDSLKLFRKCGFKITGRKTDWIRIAGRYTDEHILQLINSI